MLGQTGAKFLGIGGIAVGLDDTGDGRKMTEETKGFAVRLSLRVGLVTKIGVLGLWVDCVLRDGGTHEIERLLSDLLGDIVEAISHEMPVSSHECGQRSSDEPYSC